MRCQKPKLEGFEWKENGTTTSTECTIEEYSTKNPHLALVASDAYKRGGVMTSTSKGNTLGNLQILWI